MYFSKNQIQIKEQRSIAIFDPSEGPQSLPLEIDRSCFKKTTAEKENVKVARLNFKNSGLLYQWNERNRPGNNKNLPVKYAA